MMTQIWNDESGILTFEWILLLTLLVIGIVGGVATIRNATNMESAEAAGAIVALDQAYTISPSLGGTVTATGDFSYSTSNVSGMSGSSFEDEHGNVTISQ